MIDLIVRDDELENIKDILLKATRSGEMGDGKIFIYNVEQVIRIRTGEEGEDAL